MKGQLVLLRRLLRTVLSTENFEELINSVVSARKWRSKLSRSDQLVLLRETIRLLAMFRSFEDVYSRYPNTCFSCIKHNYLDLVRNSLK